MKYVFRIVISLILLTVLQFNFLRKTEACGPAYLTPVFDYTYAPDRPWTDFAGGKLGIIKPEYRRSVLFAAYRYLNGSGFSQPEQQALIQTWESQFNRVEPKEYSMDEAVDAWIKVRKGVIGDEAKTPDIYTERQYDSYNFFPNCSKNAFEVAAKTLSDRATSYGSDSKDVRSWLTAQDQVFETCVNGKADLSPVAQDAPEWLQKDRDYQMAAAAFYSTNYDEARERFANIAADGNSPWHEVADYLVARTLIRRSSIGRDDTRADEYSNEAESYLNGLVGRATDYNYDSRRLLNLVKFRNHPVERERELAQKLPFQNDAAELYQDLIDYSWLLDQLESEALKKEETRKEALKPPDPNANTSAANVAPANMEPRVPEGIEKGAKLTFNANLPIPAGAEANANVPYRTLDFPTSMSDEEIRRQAEAELGRPLNDAEKALLVTARRDSFYSKTNYQYESEYKGGYYGSESASLSVLPTYFGEDELTEWLFTYQIQNDEAYLHALERWHQTGSQMWLMTAVTKARPNLTGFAQVMKAADETPASSPAYLTIAYYRAKTLIDQGNKPEARKLLARVLDETVEMPVSSRNRFLQLRMKVSDSMGEFLASATRKPFGFAYDDGEDTARSIDEIIAEQKSWYNAEYDGAQSDYDAKIDQEFATKRAWQERQFFDDDVTDIINTNFPTSVMLEVLDRPELPDYLKRRLTFTVWTRAYLLKDEKTANAVAPRIAAFKPEIAPLMAAYTAAKTPAERDTAGLYLILKNGELSPYLATGFDVEGAIEPDIWQDDRWWCEQYDYDYDDAGNETPKKVFAPPFLTPQQLEQARTQKAVLKGAADGLSYLSKRVMKLAATGVPDKRLPEALYLIFQGNHWVKYGCGNNSDETRNKASDLLRTRYPRSKWTAQMFADLRESEDAGN